MTITFDLLTFIHIAAVILGLAEAVIILYFGLKNNRANQPLAIGQISISVAVFISFLIVTQLLVHWPFFYRLGNVFVLLFIPTPYLYVVFYTQKRHWKWYDLLHAIPLLIYLVDYWDVLSMSLAQKTELILLEIKDLDRLGKFNQGKFIGPGFHQEFRTVLFSLYWVAELVLVVKWIKSQQVWTNENKVWKNWMMLFLGCQFFIWFPFYLTIFWLDKVTTYHIVNSFSIVWLLLSSLSLFFFPSLLYGKPFDGANRISTLGIAAKKPPLTDIEHKKLEEVMQAIEEQMDKKKLFLITGYSIAAFSKDIELPVYQISKSLNTFKGFGFVDYINQKRIEHCVQKFEEGKWLNYTVEVVSTECGFNNRNSFTNAFKKLYEVSPSEYREMAKKKLLIILS